MSTYHDCLLQMGVWGEVGREGVFKKKKRKKKISLDLEEICRALFAARVLVFIFRARAHTHTNAHARAHAGSCSVTVEQPASWQQKSSHLQGTARFHCRPSNANTKNNCHIQTGARNDWLGFHSSCLSGSLLFIRCHEKVGTARRPRARGRRSSV